MSNYQTLEAKFQKIRNDFPTVKVKVHGSKDLVYLDSAATTLKPQPVIQRITDYYLNETSNVHRGAHYLSDVATGKFEGARQSIQQFINASSSEEIVFVRGTTEAVNLVAYSWMEPLLGPGDIILVSEMEHHANIVPWQIVAQKKQGMVQSIRVTDQGELDLEDLRAKLRQKNVKLVAITACSNTLGTVNDVELVVKMAHEVGAKVLVDGAQIVSQAAVDVQKMDCDFFVFSSHKIFGPTGFGALYTKKDILVNMPPWQGGGSMISKVSFDGTTFNDVPFRFEAGTPHIEGAVGTHAALEYIEEIGFTDIHTWESHLLDVATKGIQEIDGIRIIGQASRKAAILSFVLDGAHHSDVGQILDQMGVAVRAGHHCTQPLMARMGIVGTVRASFSIYNNLEDVQKFLEAVKKAQRMLL